MPWSDSSSDSRFILISFLFEPFSTKLAQPAQLIMLDPHKVLDIKASKIKQSDDNTLAERAQSVASNIGRDTYVLVLAT